MTLPRVGSSYLTPRTAIVPGPSGLLSLKHQVREGIQVSQMGISFQNLVEYQVLLRLREDVSKTKLRPIVSAES